MTSPKRTRCHRGSSPNTKESTVKVVFLLLDMEQEAQREAANLSAAIVL
jgi:hypothetical protein